MHFLQIKKRPYNLLLFPVFIFLLMSLLLSNKAGLVDVHFHDTYFIITLKYIFHYFAILPLFMWILYVLTNKILYSKAITWIHVMITIFTFLLITLMLFFGGNFLLAPRRYYNYNDWNSLDGIAATFAVAVCLLLLGQLLFVINFIAGLFKRKT